MSFHFINNETNYLENFNYEPTTVIIKLLIEYFNLNINIYEFDKNKYFK